MKLYDSQIERRSRAAILACLSRVPFIRNLQVVRELQMGAGRPDLTVEAEIAGKNQVWVVEVKNNGQPRAATEAVNQLLRFRAALPDAYGVFIAPYISPRAADICAKDGIGCVDFAGNCRLSFGTIYIEREGKPNLLLEKRDLRSLYSPKAGRVLRVLLNNPGRLWRIQELAREAKVSLGQAYNVKKLLEDRYWARAEAVGFRLAEPEALLKEWAKNYSYRKNQVREMYTIKSPAEFESDFAEICQLKGITYALAGFSGAARLAPSVRYQRAMAYLGSAERIDEVASLLSLKAVPSGANVVLSVPYDEGIFYGAREVDGVRVCSPAQIYLDLVGFPGRGEEAAVKILEDVLRPAW